MGYVFFCCGTSFLVETCQRHKLIHKIWSIFKFILKNSPSWQCIVDHCRQMKEWKVTNSTCGCQGINCIFFNLFLWSKSLTQAKFVVNGEKILNNIFQICGLNQLTRVHPQHLNMRSFCNWGCEKRFIYHLIASNSHI